MNVDLQKMIQIAKMYYQREYSQQQIANKLDISRSTVSRILKQAEAHGIVKIEVIDPFENVEKLAQTIKKRFRIKHCIVVQVSDYKDEVIKKTIGKAAAKYVKQIVQDGDIIGASWGTTLYQVARQLEPKNVQNVTVVQLNGGVSYSEANTYAIDILNYLGNAFNTVPHYLPLPAVVDHVVVKQAMVSDRHVHKVLELGKKANIAMYTVGETSDDSTLIKANYFNQDELDLLFNRHVVGDICSRYFDCEGNICHPELNERTIGIDLEDLGNKSYAILIAGGMNRVNGIYGALQGKYANVLVTDQHVAKSLIEMSKHEDKLSLKK